MMKTKLVRRIIHELHELFCLVDDRRPVPPCKHRRKESRDLDVLFFCKKVGDGDGIFLDKKRTVIFVNFFVEEVR